MAKRKKYPKLPNGYGQIRYLGKGRRNPYGVYPPATEEYPNGEMKPKKALCYVSDWHVGFAVLTAYKAGTYHEGMEKELQTLKSLSDGNDLSLFTNKILGDYSLITRADREPENNSPTFSEVYQKFYNWKYRGKKQYSDASKNSTAAAYKNCNVLHDKKINEISYSELQEVIDSSTLKYSSLELINSLLKQMFKYALAEELIEKNPTELLKINIEDDDEHGVPFTDEDLKILWKNKTNDIAEVLLIMCYTGFRIGELYVIDIDLKEKALHGGLKTRTSKERIVPIHSSIVPIIRRRIKEYGVLMPMSKSKFRNSMYCFLNEVGIERHTPHDCRHTFSRLCEKFEVKENDRKRLLGHKFDDVTNGVYGHRTVEDLREAIEKIIVVNVL